MKKYFFAALCCLGLALSANAQETFRKGSHDLRLGVGVSGRKYVSLPALSAIYEHSVADGLMNYGSIGLGGSVEFESYNIGGIKAHALYLAARGAFHYEFVEQLDTYIGLQAGFFNSSNSLGLSSSNIFHVSGILGARYLFNESIGIFGELATGEISTFKVGVSFSL